MKVILNVTIDIGDNGDHCGNCRFLENSFDRGGHCRLFDIEFDDTRRLERCKYIEHNAKEDKDIQS